MPSVRDILKEKGGDVVCVQPDVSVLSAIHLMNEHQIGAVVVTQSGRVAGMFTERDVLRRVVAEELPPGEVLVRDVMTTAVACCRPETKLDEARSVMKNRRIRHLPVVDNDARLLGLISIGDLNAYHTDGQETTIRMLEDYLYGRT